MLNPHTELPKVNKILNRPELYHTLMALKLDQTTLDHLAEVIDKELTQQAREILDSISETVEASPQPKMHHELRTKLTTLRTQYGVDKK